MEKKESYEVSNDFWAEENDTGAINGIGVMNGVLNLRNGVKLIPYWVDSPVGGFVAGCNYEEDADCPAFKKWLATVVPKEEDRIELQKALGSIFFPRHTMPAVALNGNENASSIFLSTILNVIGSYGSTVNFKDIRSSSPKLDGFVEKYMFVVEGINHRYEDIPLYISRSCISLYRRLYEKVLMVRYFKGVAFFQANEKQGYFKEKPRFLEIYFDKAAEESKSEDFESEYPGILNYILEGMQLHQQDYC